MENESKNPTKHQNGIVSEDQTKTPNSLSVPASQTNGAIGASNTEVILKAFKERPTLQRRVGRTLFFFVIICWMFVAAVVILLQLLLVITGKLSSRNSWQKFHREAKGLLLHLLLIPTICAFYFWNNIQLRIVCGDKRLNEIAFDPVISMMIPNHSNDIDYLLCTILADQLKNVHCYKPLVKHDLKYMPIFGWVLWLSDVPFVKRDWSEDKLSLGKQLDRLLVFDQCSLCLFAEGTRWSEAKHKASVEYAKKSGIKPLKYHLLPRKRGFRCAVRHYLLSLRDNRRNGTDMREFKIYNLQFLSPRRMTAGDYVNGNKIKAEVYIERVTIDDEIIEEVYNSKSEEDCHKLDQMLLGIFRRKDEIVDEYKANGFKLPLTGERGLYPFEGRRIPPLMTCIFGLALVHIFLVHLFMTIGWFYFCCFAVCFFLTSVQFQRRIARETKGSRHVLDASRTPLPSPLLSRRNKEDSTR